MSVGMQACCRLVRADVLSLYGILPFLWSFLLIYMICDLGGRNKPHCFISETEFAGKKKRSVIWYKQE